MAPGPLVDAGQDLILRHVTVVDLGNGQLAADRTVVVQAGKIVQVGASSQVQEPAQVQAIDATGSPLSPCANRRLCPPSS